MVEKKETPLLFLPRKALGSNNSFTPIENNFGFLRRYLNSRYQYTMAHGENTPLTICHHDDIFSIYLMCCWFYSVLLMYIYSYYVFRILFMLHNYPTENMHVLSFIFK